MPKRKEIDTKRVVKGKDASKIQRTAVVKAPPKSIFKNKERVLVVSSRGITFR